MKINKESVNIKLIEKTLKEFKNDIIDICTNENLNLSYFTDKVNNIEDTLNTLDSVSLFIDDKGFLNEFVALKLVSQRIVDNQFEFFENKNFRNAQIDSLYTFGVSIENEIDEEYNTNIEYDTFKKEVDKNNDKKVKIKKESEKLVDDANEKLKNYFENPKLMKEYLEYMSKFYKYSERNSLLIDEQFKGAKAVGSFKFWSNQGYKINKGEKGIKILVPVNITYFKDKNNNEKQLKYATKEEKEKIKNKEIDTYSKTYFNVGYVFDISQTNAPLEDLPKIFPNKWIDGDVANHDKMYKALEKVADTIGVKIIEPKSELGYVKGVSYTETREVALNPRNGQLQNIKTLLHELAHAKLHTFETRGNYTKEEREYQAEMVAYATCSYFGLDTSEYSLEYLNCWTKNLDLNNCKKIIKEVKETTSQYIEIIENELVKDRDFYRLETKEIILDDLYVKFISSESEVIKDDDKYDFRTANELVSTLSEMYVTLNTPKNTKFEIYGDEKYSNRLYCGSMDIGNGLDYDLQNHMFKLVKNKNINIDEKTKNKFIELFKPNFDKKTIKSENEIDVYVKFNWSEHSDIEKNSIYKYKDADRMLKIFTERCKLEKSHTGYYKTSFELHTDKECKGNPFYSGRFDIGDGYATNLSDHIYKVVTKEFTDISEGVKNNLFSMLGINNNTCIVSDKSI